MLDYGPGELRKFLKGRGDRHFAYLRRAMNPDDAGRVIALKAPAR